MKAARILVMATLLLAACSEEASRPAEGPHASLEPCSVAMPGAACELPMSDGPSPAVSLCKKLNDGSIRCDADAR